jgi:hypothetical protein
VYSDLNEKEETGVLLGGKFGVVVGLIKNVWVSQIEEDDVSEPPLPFIKV